MKIMLYGSPVATLEVGLRDRLGPAACFVTADYSDPPEILAERLDGCEAMVAVRYNDAVPATDTIRLIQIPGLGYDEIDFESLPPYAALCNVGEHAPAVAEYTIGALLARATNLIEQDTAFRAGNWTGSSRMGASPHGELVGSRVGIVGYGAIGRALATRLRPFGTDIAICNRSHPTDLDADIAYHPLSSLADMAAECNILIVTVALTPETTGMIDETVLAALPQGAVLVNVARGPVVSEDALYRTLSNGHLGGAILDVWWSYPADVTDTEARSSRYDFTQFPSVIVTPHISGWSSGTLSRRLDVIARNILRTTTGEPFENLVRKGS
mgnify:CR=1 FL=1